MGDPLEASPECFRNGLRRAHQPSGEQLKLTNRQNPNPSLMGYTPPMFADATMIE